MARCVPIRATAPGVLVLRRGVDGAGLRVDPGEGPEAGLHERASAAEICAYYQRVLNEQLVASGRVEFHPNCEYLGDGSFVSRLSGERYQAGPNCRIVDARYLAPEIPATTEPPFGVADGVRALPVNELPRLETTPGEFVIVGSGKTATDACVWLLESGVDPDSICWVRPREPWMFDRAVLQPDPAVFIGMAADTMEAAGAASSPDDLFLRMEAAGVMLRIDPSVTPTMAKTPTLARWELDLLRSIERVVRLGHVRGVERGRIELDEGDAAIHRDAVVVHCAASGLQYPPLIPIWGDEVITIQPVRAGFPCLGAALTGYVEATREDDAEKNRMCLPSPLSNAPTDWAVMQVLGGRASLAFWRRARHQGVARRLALNPARVPAGGPSTSICPPRQRASARPSIPGSRRWPRSPGLGPDGGEPGRLANPAASPRPEKH